jgi:hypothetical protein
VADRKREEPRDGHDGHDDVLRLLAGEMGEPRLRRDIMGRLDRLPDPALRRRVIGLLERDPATLSADERELLASTLSTVLRADGERSKKARAAGGRAAARWLLWPEGWPGPLTLAAIGCLTWGFGGLLVVVGLVAVTDVVAGGQPAYVLAIGLIFGGFGAGLLLMWSLAYRRPGGGVQPRLTTVQDGGDLRTGVDFPYSRARVVRGIAAAGGVCLAGAGLLLGTAVGLGWPGLAGGVLLLLVGVVGVVGPLRRGVGRDWRLVLLPEGVLHLKGGSRMFVAWDQILMVDAHRFAQVGAPPRLTLVIDVQAAVETAAQPPRRRTRWRRTRLVELSRDVWRLAVDPSLVYAALRYYTAHPEARVELGDSRGVQRLQGRELS